MGNKKIDHLFQEQLKNLEVSPNKRVWNNVKAQLTKKKRRIFPFWWFSGAVASILVVVLFFYPFSNDENQNINNNFDEIMTIIPEKKIKLNTIVDSLSTEQTPKNQILMTKIDKVSKITRKKNSNFTIPKKEGIQTTHKIVNPIAINHQPMLVDFTGVQQNTFLHHFKLKDSKSKQQKLNITEVIKKKENTQPSKKTKNWSISPTFAVLKSNSLTDTSPINASLSQSTSGENTYAYGVQIAYKLNKKWSVQSGIYLQEMSYANKQIAVNTSSSRNPFATEFSNGASFSFSTNFIRESAALSDNSFISNLTNTTGNVAQNYGYIEIPIEIKYNFSGNTKLTSEIVTGFSTLFLNKNEVVLSTQNFTQNLEAPNLNDINFSGNFGFDFNYFLTTKWSFNINPMFKVQLNTFSNNANGFTPFNLGLYSGIKYQF